MELKTRISQTELAQQFLGALEALNEMMSKEYATMGRASMQEALKASPSAQVLRGSDAATTSGTFWARLNRCAEPDDLFEMTPVRFVMDNVAHYVMSFSQWRLRPVKDVRKPGIKEALLEKAATARLDGETPTERSWDLTLLPEWIDKSLALLKAHPEVFRPEEARQKEAFEKLHGRMKAKAEELIVIRGQIQESLQRQR